MGVTVSKAQVAGKVALLQKHLQVIAAVEYTTLPFYLTATYSFTKDALAYNGDNLPTPPLFAAQQTVLSVAVQEMYHLQEACNLGNSVGVDPNLPMLSMKAGKKITVPYIVHDGKPLVLELGNLPQAIADMAAIEQADPSLYPPPNENCVYGSIAELYHATWQLMTEVYKPAAGLAADAADDTPVEGGKQVVYGTFGSTYTYNAVTSPQDAMNVINAIADQGEGQVVAKLMLKQKHAAMLKAGSGDVPQTCPQTVQKQFQASAGSRFADASQLTHYQRFLDVGAVLNSQDWEAAIGGPMFYQADGKISKDLPSWAPKDAKVVQNSLNAIWSYTVDLLHDGFSMGTLNPNSTAGKDKMAPTFTEAMMAFKYVIPMMWQLGHCPSFVYKKNVTAKKVQAAMDVVDPLCLFHWDTRTRKLLVEKNMPTNACQGLNECAGKGWGGLGTTKGDGACATAGFHTCGANNMCGAEGGCGFLVSKSGEACSSKTAAPKKNGCGAPAKPANLCGGGKPSKPTNLCGGGGGGGMLPASEEWIPGQNGCKAKGGCETPISTQQVFNVNAGPMIDAQTDWSDADKARLKGLIGENVWDTARTQMAAKWGVDPSKLPQPQTKKIGDIDYDGTKRRSCIQPTSAK
ncbi:MAG TPA: ferritin-like domain-containing protein [Candidatus Omnitrophota bacterium]|nr:ferritin-like domain-containing protein [Candidatus Omnitrophota bacterium]